MASPVDIIDTIIKVIELGKEIHSRYKTFTRADDDLSELESRLQASLVVLEVFHKVIKRGIESFLYHQQLDIARLIGHLQGVFDRLDKELSRFPHDEKLSFVGKLRWTFRGKSGYEAILQEMIAWRRDVVDVVTAIKFLQDGEKEEDRNLYQQLFKECGGPGARSADMMDDALHGRSQVQLPIVKEVIASAVDAKGNRKDADRMIIQGHLTFVEYRYHETRGIERDLEESLSDVKKLVAVLSQVDTASTHILRCKGTIYQSGDWNRSLLFYEIPSEPASNTPYWTLAQGIEDKHTSKPALQIRVRYAVEICMAVMFTHAAGLVHKSINPDNVLLLRPPADHHHGGLSAYLAGFDAARLRDLSAYSAQRPENNPMKALYQHPERHTVEEDGKVIRFGIRHDMYSMGIVLLELAIWGRIHSINDPDFRMLKNPRGQRLDPRKLQAKLADLVERSLDGVVGSKYRTAVLSCLRDSVSDLKQERDMRQIFYEQVLCPLKQIVV